MGILAKNELSISRKFKFLCDDFYEIEDGLLVQQ